MTDYEYAIDDQGETARKRSHRVLVLDPACGTGTFLYAVIDHIREYYRGSGNAACGMDMSKSICSSGCSGSNY